MYLFQTGRLDIDAGPENTKTGALESAKVTSDPECAGAVGQLVLEVDSRSIDDSLLDEEQSVLEGGSEQPNGEGGEENVNRKSLVLTGREFSIILNLIIHLKFFLN